MKRGGSRIKKNVERLANMPLVELMEAFKNFLQLPENWGNPMRTRLFPPLYNLLALSLPGTLG